MAENSKNKVWKKAVVTWVAYVYSLCMVLLYNVRKSHLRIHEWYLTLKWQLTYLLVKMMTL